MPSISSFTGQQLLDQNVVTQESREAEILLKNKDIAGAWQASRHLKTELSKLPAQAVAPVLPDYRKISTNLKALALPLLEKDEVINLLQNNLSYLDAGSEPYLLSGLTMWLSAQTEEEAAKAVGEFKQVLSKDNPLSERIKAVLERHSTPASSVTLSLSNPPPAFAPQGGATAGKPTPTDEMFDDHEQAELANGAAKVGAMGGAALKLDGLSDAARVILKLVQREQDQEAFLKRAQALITSRVRDVRTLAELKEYLHRPWAVGGLGLDEDKVGPVSDLIEQEYKKVHSSVRTPSPAGEGRGEGPAVPGQIKLADNTPPPLAPHPSPLPEGEGAIKTVPSTPAPPVITETPLPSSPTRISRPVRAVTFSDKPRLDDVKVPVPAGPHSVGAADEFKLLTVADWRGLGNASQAAAEILRRAELLRQESLAAYVQGIKFWRESELFQAYVALGQASLTQGKKLAQVLADPNLNPHSLTEEDFFAIASLNGKLK